MDSKHLFPLIIPIDYVGSSILKLPHQKFPISEFALTWVEFNSSSSMTYLTETRFKELNNTIANWQQLSFENLRESGDYFHTHVKYRENSDHVIFLSFINSDGIGSSRILLNMELTQGFPNGYYLAFPDRSCGLIISKEIDKQELDEVRHLVKKMHKTATIPMSDEIYDPMEFSLPSNWTSPIEQEISEQIIAAIPKSS